MTGNTTWYSGISEHILRTYASSSKEDTQGKTHNLSMDNTMRHLLIDLQLGNGYGGYWHCALQVHDEVFPKELRLLQQR
jgi:hypothetical protein